MLDFIIIAIISVIVAIGVQSGGKSSDGDDKKRTVVVKGMTSGHCKTKVEQCIKELGGATAKVNLKKKTVTVYLERAISNKQIQTAIEKAGYEVLEIR